MSSARRHVSLACLLFAWFCANGAIWDVVQVVAWGRMFTQNVKNQSIGRALLRTFDGSEPCKLCALARTGHDAEQQAPAPASGHDKKIPLVCHTAAPVVFAPPDFSWPEIPSDSGCTRTEPVPVPPPRV